VLRVPAERIERPGAGQPASEAWWALGDAPVRVAEALAPLVDGRSAMLAMCVAFLAARREIWLADWDLHAQLQMVRGRDWRAGPDTSPEQIALVERLRAAGLDAAALALWTSGRLRVVDVLGFAAERGVTVRVLLWSPFNPFGLLHIINDPGQQQRWLEARGIQCRQDRNSRSPFHVAQALHQKCAVVDGHTAFVGGVDLTVEYGGDFDRWDTVAHPFALALRSTDLGPAPHPWHDVHSVLTGAAAGDVQRNVEQRWHEAGWNLWGRLAPPLLERLVAWRSATPGSDDLLREAERGVLPPGAGPQEPGPAARVQVVRTIPALTYRFAPRGIHGIAQAYLLALRQARRFIYLESQYLWLEGFNGLDIWRLGWESHHMRALMDELAAAAGRGVTIGLVLPDHPNTGRSFTDHTLQWLRERVPQAIAAGRLRVFTLATSAPRRRDGLMRYRPVYVHAKVGIVDDRWATIGSANLNSRGMSHDAELNVAVLDDAVARGLRLTLWAEHAGLLPHAETGWPAPAALPRPPDNPDLPRAGVFALFEPMPVPAAGHHPGGGLAALDDPVAGLEELWRRAQANLERLRRNERLQGPLLPYLTPAEGRTLGLEVDPDRGLLDPWRAQREGVRIPHPRRYI
jgi:phosphatidylserine/phosphatidylglycerophosphate/cardiolipin synthase-like enzyme